MRHARVKGGRAKFLAHQMVASNAVPLYRKVRSLDGPLAERYLFVLAHPRSGSTVLSHVLHSHPDIVGFGEHHEGYASESDLQALAARNAFHDHDPRTTHRYTLDKVVWNHHEFSDAVLAHPDTRFVFLLREPVATLDSYRRMFEDMTTDQRRLRSYQTRLDGLEDLAARIADPSRMAMVTYGELTNDTDVALERITSMLELGEPLTKDYEVTAKSGRQSWGDPSQNIKAGTILALEGATPAPTEPIDLDVLDAAHVVFERSCNRLAELVSDRPAAPAPAPAPR